MPTRTPAPYAATTGRSATTPSDWRPPTSAGTARTGPTRWTTPWPSAPSTTPCSTWAYWLFDLGVLGLTEDLRVRVSGLYTARSGAGRAVDILQDRPLARPRPGLPRTAETFVRWHTAQVFKHTAAPAA
ncbi:hypothetical protein LO771_12260 [Streptacidiphilus sp. ASG 303]|nr:hypothetical protein [Streptacidiphilus sp. ASG 303]MCD0483159.1 hypothetical protein [Streptacidiphilus sp. ASG 303]